MRGVPNAHISKSTSQAGSKKTISVKASNGKQSASAKVTIKK